MPASTSQWKGTASIRGSSEPLRMMLLTFGFIGLQFGWNLESTYCTPLILSLGLPKSQTSLVFIAGPLTGLIMQPLIGAITDRSTSRFGRRRPFIAMSGVFIGCCLMFLAWTKEIISFFISNEWYQKHVAIATAILVVYTTDISMNALHTALRSLMVDVLPISQQQTGSAWASRISGFSSLANYAIGTLNLVRILPLGFPGDTQFKRMAVVSALTLWLTIAVTCFSVTERVQVSSPNRDASIWGLLPSTLRRAFHLPARVQGICWVQFWAWIGWFPFLFYSSTWVGETYYRYEHPVLQENEDDVLGNVGRLGSLALLMFSVISFMGSILFPHMVESTENSNKEASFHTPEVSYPLPSSLKSVTQAISRIPKPTLLTAWQMSHFAFAFILAWAPFVRSLVGATFLVGLCGIPGSVSIWAPFAEMGMEINRLAEPVTVEEARTLLPEDEVDIMRQSMESERIVLSAQIPGRARAAGGLSLPQPSALGDEGDDSSGQLAGIYMGVLNVYTTLPQFVGTIVSWIAFSILEPNRGDSGDDGNDSDNHDWLATKGVNAISVCFFIGALSALVAAESTRRLKKIS